MRTGGFLRWHIAGPGAALGANYPEPPKIALSGHQMGGPRFPWNGFYTDEAFGLPPLAMSCGIPVDYGNNSAMVEIIGRGDRRPTHMTLKI
jgi:hypothetical protein